ncbi:MAG: electron transfer flavoprotein subunit beta/FixA family protein [Clostridia bacterium]|nr:electron transfer flavoprotein subunit beta/FixA family protein [Clostridia bacterium]
MNILVCVKQVPGTSQVEVDPVTGVLKRDGQNNKLNPYDLFALETALRIREEQGGEIKTVSMGPPQATSSLLETVYMGADAAYLISDRLFAGADVHATSYAIASGIRRTGAFDLILCGKQTTDGDTAQVGPELAEMLGIEHAANVLSIDAIDDKSVTVTMNLDNLIQTQTMLLPCLLTIEKDACTPRLPSFKRKLETASDVVTVLTAADLTGLDPARCGLKGSPTQVERIFPPEVNKNKEQFAGTGEQLSDTLFDLLQQKKFV